MGGSADFGVRVSSLHAAAATLRENATALHRHSRAVGEHACGGHAAGRDYAMQGKAIHQGFERIAACLRYWSEASAATAEVFDRAAGEYARIDRERAASLVGATDRGEVG
ncbi:hypothetical protein VMT65_18020 [Nocardia sp. CDC153]|uniref:hypothetical protein n=1 Tax=Nocardia sp. CDC153 TaxID=3112167 RepID=UPI002DBDE03A|nr:hypothetical protein [Nocardia sp. CDC153]MEC3954943.1 hypothetical protein [Nocardia sp. CDC153]